MRQALVSAGVKRWRLLTVFPMGRAASDPEMTPLLCYYGCEGFLGEYEAEVRDHFFDCEAGISVVTMAS